jgi:preprotein translocase subunit SecG
LRAIKAYVKEAGRNGQPRRRRVDAVHPPWYEARRLRAPQAIFAGRDAKGSLFMQSVLIVIHILIVVALIAVVLLQRSEGGALGAGGGTGSFMTGRGQANALSRATAILGAMFFATALLMSILSSWSRAPHSILEKGPAPAGQTAPVPMSPGNILDQLKQLEGQSNTPAAPAAPQPAAPAAPEQKP